MHLETISLLLVFLFLAFSIFRSPRPYLPRREVVVIERSTWNSRRSFKKKTRRGHLFNKAPPEVAQGRGKKKGSPGRGRKRPIQWDRTVHVVPQQCDRPGCGVALPDEDHDSYDRFVIEITIEKKRILGETTRYVVHRKWCPKCGALVTGNSLVPAFRNHLFGYGFLTFVMYKRIELKMSLAKIVRDLEMFMLPSDLCSPTSICNWVKRISEDLEPLYQELITLMKQNPYLHVDETGLPLDGKQWWMWVLATELIVIYHAAETRGHKAIKELLSDYAGILVTNFWSAYEKMPQEQQKCLVHLLRDLMNVIVRAMKKKNGSWRGWPKPRSARHGGGGKRRARSR